MENENNFVFYKKEEMVIEMKILTKTNKYGELCYVQVKDILFLARIVKSNRILTLYINLLNEGKGENDFVRIISKSYIKLIKESDFIVDFCEYSSSNIGITYISNLLVSMNCFSCSSYMEQEKINHKNEALRDIIDFKKGELDYTIPVVPDGNVEIVNEDNSLIFNSTVLDNCYTLTSITGVDVNTIEYDDFFRKCIDEIYENQYPELEKNEREYKYYDRGKTFILFVQTSKKKKRKISRVLEKLRK